MLFVVFSPLLMGVWKVFFGHVVFFCFVFFTSTASCGPSSSDHSSWGGPAHPFSHEPQHRHTVHRHGEVPLQRERERERENGKSERGGMWGMWAHSHICQPTEQLALKLRSYRDEIMARRAQTVKHLQVSVCLWLTCSSSVRGTSASGCMGSSCRIAANSLSCMSSGTWNNNNRHSGWHNYLSKLFSVKQLTYKQFGGEEVKEV